MTYKKTYEFVDTVKISEKPRQTGLIEIRGPYYEAFTVSQLDTLLQTWGHYIDGFKFAGGVQSLLTAQIVKAFTDTAHKYNVYVNTGGFIERVVIQDPKNVDAYLQETKELGFDVIEVSSGMFENTKDFPIEHQVEIVKKIEKLGLKPKPEITIMSGVGGGTAELDYSKKVKASKTIEDMLVEGQKFFDAGAYMLMIESEGITEGIKNSKEWRKDVIFALVEKFGHQKLMFEVSPEDDEARQTFKWYLQNIGKDINLMMNSKNIVEYNAWRLNLWGNRELWKTRKE